MTTHTSPWLTIVGIGEDGMDGLTPAARTAVEQAEIIIGGERHHQLSGTVTAERLSWPHPFDALIDTLQAHRGRRIVVIATGDPLWFSVGARIGREIPPAEITYHPQLSAFQWASARMGWSLADVETLTAHGRPVEQILPWLWPGAHLLILTSGAHTPGHVAHHLKERGFGSSQMTVLGALGGPNESRFDATAQVWADSDPSEILPAFNTLAVTVKGRPRQLLSRMPGLPDDAFRHDGKITKQEIRAVTLAHLMPARGEILWDLGVGCGSVAIEWMRAMPDAIAVGIDNNADRLAMAKENANALGAPRLHLIEGGLPDALDQIPGPAPARPDLRQPNAVFIGGGLTPDLFKRAWAALPEGGRLVANAVTLQTEEILLAIHARMGGALTRMSIQRAAPVGDMTGWRPAMPVTQWTAVK